MWAFVGNSLQTGDLMSRGPNARAWVEPGVGGAEKPERAWAGPSRALADTGTRGQRCQGSVSNPRLYGTPEWTAS